MVYKKEGSCKWWYSFTFHGRRYQKSSGVENRKEAEGIEAAFRTSLAKGEVGVTDRPRFTIEQLLDRLEQRWQLERKATKQNLSLLKKTKEDWGTKLADDLTASQLEQYAIRRQRQDYSNASTNRVLQCLRRAFNLAPREAKLTWPKEFDLLPEDNRRTGFAAAEQMEKLLAALPNDGLRDYVRFAWCTGMRKAEAASLKWSFIHDNQLVVSAEYCKSGKPHSIPISGPLVAIIERRRAARVLKSNGGAQLCEFLFHRDGAPIQEFRKSWRTAARSAGCGNLLFHDLRRSAVRDMIRSGVPQSVAMKITGHRTIAVFNRYDITAADDMTAALEKTAKYRAG
jgi:integrase